MFERERGSILAKKIEKLLSAEKLKTENLIDLIRSLIKDLHITTSQNNSDLAATVSLLLISADDTPDNLRLLSTMLIEQGYEVRSVINGKMALMGAKAEPPDLILLDINMPQMNGYEVCQHLKADNKTAGIPIIFIRALEDVLDKVKAFAVGGVDYITKPFQLEEVLVRIHTHLSLCRLQKQLQYKNEQLQREIHQKEQAEERFTKAFRSSPNPIAIASLNDGQLLEANPSFMNFSGYTLSEIINKPVDKIWISPVEKSLTTAIKNLEINEKIYDQELELKTRNNETRVVLLSLEK
jgi:PAS domain S-box-containing protein